MSACGVAENKDGDVCRVDPQQLIKEKERRLIFRVQYQLWAEPAQVSDPPVKLTEEQDGCFFSFVSSS